MTLKSKSIKHSTVNDRDYVPIGLSKEEAKMWTADEFKRDKDKQIMAFSIAFFLLAFPLYFGFVASGADESSLGGTGTYIVGGEVSFIELDSGMEYVADGDTWTIDDLSTDSIDGADDMNIIGVMVTLSYGEDERANGPTCAANDGQPSGDTISGTVMHGMNNASESGNNDGGNGAHVVESTWINTSMIGELVFLSESEIVEEIDANGAGLGAYSVEISVSAEAGNAPGPLCQREDNGEEVTYKVELMVYDYDIMPFIDLGSDI